MFVCSELIEELASLREMNIDIYVSNNESTIMFDLSKIFTPKKMENKFSHLFNTISMTSNSQWKSLYDTTIKRHC